MTPIHKITLTLLFCFLGIVLCRAQGNYQIKGQLNNLNHPFKVFLTYKTDQGIVQQKAMADKGHFEFEGLINEPVNATIKVDRENGGRADKLDFYLESGTITIVAKDSIKQATVKGSVSHLDYIRYRKMLQPLEKETADITAIVTKMNSESTTIKKLLGKSDAEIAKDSLLQKKYLERYIALDAEKYKLELEFAKKNPQSYIGMVSLKNAVSRPLTIPDCTVATAIYTKMADGLKTSALGLKVKNEIETLKRTAIGTAVDFVSNTPEGKPVRLSDFKGKYVLVDFWASWCAPCRAESPYLLAAYQKYKSRAFTILGFSMDTSKQDWLKAIKDDGLLWTQLSDLKGNDGELPKKFGIRGIPFNFLIDPKGVVVAKNLRGDDLEKKLAALIGNK